MLIRNANVRIIKAHLISVIIFWEQQVLVRPKWIAETKVYRIVFVEGTAIEASLLSNDNTSRDFTFQKRRMQLNANSDNLFI